MSLQALSTELDVAIIKYLDRGSQSRLSLASKYYRRITEHLLYSVLRFFNNENDRIKQLLLMLVSREDLRHSIMSFELLHKRCRANSRYSAIEKHIPAPPDRQGDDLCEYLMAQSGLITIALSELAVRYGIGTQYKMSLYAKIFESLPLFDGALALILCMATKFTTIDLELSPSHGLPTTRSLMDFGDWVNPGQASDARPFGALKTLRLRGITNGRRRNVAYDAVGQPELQTLDIEGNDRLHAFCLPPFPTAGASVLTTLLLKDTAFDPLTL
jgi:hypothetical protein